MIIDESCFERGCSCYDYRIDKGVEVRRKEWVGLTDEERNWLRKRNQKHDDYAKAVEALLKEKNT